jgi:hypothetical protein
MHANKWNIGCIDTQCIGYSLHYRFERKKDALSAWNTRTDAVDIDKVREVIVELLLGINSFSPPSFNNKLLAKMADKLTAALQEKGNG